MGAKPADESQHEGEVDDGVTVLLNRCFSLPVDSDDRRDAEDALFRRLESRFRGIASRLMRNERAGHLEQSTALANLAFVKSIRKEQREFGKREEFFNHVACVMRCQLVDWARQQDSAKRIPREWSRWTFARD